MKCSPHVSSPSARSDARGSGAEQGSILNPIPEFAAQIGDDRGRLFREKAAVRALLQAAFIAALSGLLLVSACGKKGDPKPPADPATQTEESKKKPAQ